MGKKYEALDRFWLKYYIDKETKLGLCMLCGNTGIIKLKNVIAPNGIKLKDRNEFCICPNGRSLRGK